MTVLDRVINRCKLINGIDGIVLCTSTNSQDSLLYNFALKHQIQFFPGSEDDVINRLFNAAEYFNYDAFLSITADNPLFSIYTSQVAFDWFKKERFDFIYTQGLPVGLPTYFLKTDALKIVCRFKKVIDTEIWGPIINQPDFFKIGKIEVENSPFKEDKRLTCDYIEDYSLIRNIFMRFYPEYTPNDFEIIDILNKNPELWKLNSKHKQSSLEKKKIQEINGNFKLSMKKMKEFAITERIVFEPGILTRHLVL